MKREEKIKYLIIVNILYFCGAAFGRYMSYYVNQSTIIAHLFQWLPLLFGAIIYVYFGRNTKRWFSMFSRFGRFGLTFVLFVAPGVGYVLAYNIF